MTDVLKKEKTQWWSYKTRNAKDTSNHQKLGGGKEGPSPRDFTGSVALRTPCFQISGLQNCERIHFCYFKPSSMWYFVSALGNELLLFARSVMSDSLQLHGLQHTRLACPSLSPRVCSNSYPLSLWCHSTITSSVSPFSSCPQFFPASGSFPMSQLFTSGGQSIGVSVLPSVLSMNIQDWFPLGWTGWISLQSKGLSGVFYSTVVWKHQFFSVQPSLWSNSHIHTWLMDKPQLWLYRPLSAKWCLCFLIHCLGLS